jgi:hypothetical protein
MRPRLQDIEDANKARVSQCQQIMGSRFDGDTVLCVVEDPWQQSMDNHGTVQVDLQDTGVGIRDTVDIEPL